MTSRFLWNTVLVVFVAALAWPLSACTASAPAATDDTSGAVIPQDLSAADAGMSVAAAPLAGPVGQWKWTDVPGAVCGYRQQTGIAVNAGTGSDLLIYLEGGGLCWDGASCATAIPGFAQLASYFTNGYTAETFASVVAAGALPPQMFDRTVLGNPFKDSSFVYVPYCTGDFLTGSKTVASNEPLWPHELSFVGRKNLDLFLSQIVPSFPSASHVTLAGSSAGGFASLLNYDHVAQAFGGKRVDLVSDSGPFFWGWDGPVMPGAFAAWNMKAALPADCPQCAANPAALYPYLSHKYPNSRFAFLTHDQDIAMATGLYVVPFFPNFLYDVKALTTSTLGPLPNWKYFVAQGLEHTFETTLRATSTQQNQRCNWVFGVCFPYWVPQTTVLADWLTEMVTDSPQWQSTTSIFQ